MEHVVRTRMFITDADDAEAVGRSQFLFFETPPKCDDGGRGRLLDPRWRVEIEAEALIR